MVRAETYKQASGEDVWDIEVEDVHHFFAEGVLVHNSQRIKNPKAQRTKQLLKLRPYSSVRSILSGTPILRSPWDAFSQFSFLDPSIVRTESYTAFKAQFAELIPHDHGLMRHIEMRLTPALMQRFLPRCGGNRERAAAIVKEHMRKFGPQIVARDEITGLPKWRNLDKLEALLAPYSFRVLKKDCLDLPEKIYSQRSYTMTPRQREIYDKMEQQFRLMLDSGEETAFARIATLNKLCQICSGYVIVPGTAVEQRIFPADKNPKLDILMEEIESCIEAGEQVIVWAAFKVELRDIAEACRKREWTFVEYHGDIGSRVVRSANIDAFESGAARIFISQPAAGGTGLTLVAPNSVASSMTVIYYSNTNKLEDRMQSEDRAHRIGQEKSVRYLDIQAEASIEIQITENLLNKKDIADIVTGDKRRAAELLL